MDLSMVFIQPTISSRETSQTKQPEAHLTVQYGRGGLRYTQADERSAKAELLLFFASHLDHLIQTSNHDLGVRRDHLIFTIDHDTGRALDGIRLSQLLGIGQLSVNPE